MTTVNPLTYEQAKEFSKHPLRAYDPHGARCAYSFTNVYRAFMQFIKDELRDLIKFSDDSVLEDAKKLAELKTMYHQVRTKVDNFAYHSGNALLPPYRYARSSGYPRGLHPMDL